MDRPPIEDLAGLLYHHARRPIPAFRSLVLEAVWTEGGAVHDDPKLYRMIGCCLIVVCMVCLLTLKRIPLIVAIPTLAFFFWRWWEQRHRRDEHWIFRLWRLLRKQKKPGTSLVLVNSKRELVERKSES
ncbi:MAG TPA: hypothetical protein VFE22_03965 [Edaphobacter sp.]|nr:hypothetical protein [Edaphobacter sp.]